MSIIRPGVRGGVDLGWYVEVLCKGEGREPRGTKGGGRWRWRGFEL